MLFDQLPIDTLGPTQERLTRLDYDTSLRKRLLPYCRLRPGEIWEDKKHGHRVALMDACDTQHVARLMDGSKAQLAVNDPPYNIRVGNRGTDALFSIPVTDYMRFTRAWVQNTLRIISDHSAFYAWLGADIRAGFQPLPDFMLLMREYKELEPRNFITMRNQRGYGTQRNWMWVRQELLHYEKNRPPFNVLAEYTNIPKILRGYYKNVGGETKENLARSKSENIRAGNVWVDVQQVFYRMVENVPGCYAQKPLKAIERIINASSDRNDNVVDLFSHSGTTLIAGETLGRRVFTCDNDPIFAELTIRRLERYRRNGVTGWQ